MDGSRHLLSFTEEALGAQYGSVPDTPVFRELRNTGCTLALTKATNQSAEIRNDRQVSDYRHGTRQTGGNVNFEFSYGTFDRLLEGAMCGDWIPEGQFTDENTISAAAADHSFNDSANGFVAAGFKAGRVITVTSFVTGANNGRFKIVTCVPGKITVTKWDGTAAPLVNEAAGPLVDMVTDAMVLETGVEIHAYSFLRHFQDAGAGIDPYHYYLGTLVNTFNLSLTPGGIVTGSFALLGQDLQISDELTDDASFVPYTTTRVFDAFTGGLTEGGNGQTVVTELTLTLENGVAPKFVCFSDKTLLPQVGLSNLTGSISFWFESLAVYEKFLNETASDISFNLVDKDGNAYYFTLPKVVYNGGQPDTSGPGSITITVPFQAILDATTGTNFKITRVPKPAVTLVIY